MDTSENEKSFRDESDGNCEDPSSTASVKQNLSICFPRNQKKNYEKISFALRHTSEGLNPQCFLDYNDVKE